MMNPCIEFCYHKTGKSYSPDCDDKCEFAKIVQEKKQLEEEMNQPVSTLEELAMKFCSLTECMYCPVIIHEYEERTKYEKEILHKPCYTNLIHWISEQSKRV